MRSIPTLTKSAACALIGIAALGFACAASAQTAAPETNAPAASQGAGNAEAAESSRRTRRRAQETPAPAPEAAPTEAAATKPASDALVCKNVKPAGSRLPERVCYTQAQWDSLSEASQDDMRRARDRSRASGARPQ